MTTTEQQTAVLTIIDAQHPGRPPLLMNDSVHWSKKSEARDRIYWQITRALQQSPIAPMQRGRVEIVQFAPDGLKRDADGLGLFRKSVLDALVKRKVFPDDNVRHVIDGGNRIEVDRQKPRMEIRITEVLA